MRQGLESVQVCQMTVGQGGRHVGHAAHCGGHDCVHVVYAVAVVVPVGPVCHRSVAVELVVVGGRGSVGCHHGSHRSLQRRQVVTASVDAGQGAVAVADLGTRRVGR